MDTNEIIKRYTVNKAPNTLRRLETVVSDFEKFIGAKLIKATQSDAMDYHDDLHTRKGIKARVGGAETLSGRTIRNTIDMLKGICEYCVKRQWMRRNPFVLADIWLPPKEFNEKRPTEAADFNKVMDMCNGPDRKSKRGLRDRAILSCLFAGGMRKSEVINLLCRDVRIFNGRRPLLYLQIRKAKNCKPLEKALPDWASERVAAYVQVRKSEGAAEDDALFVNYRTQEEIPTGPIPVSTFDAIFHKWRERADMPRTITPHSARATVFNKLVNDGISPNMISKYMGVSEQTIGIYYRPVFGEVVAVAKKVVFH